MFTSVLKNKTLILSNDIYCDFGNDCTADKTPCGHVNKVKFMIIIWSDLCTKVVLLKNPVRKEAFFSLCFCRPLPTPQTPLLWPSVTPFLQDVKNAGSHKWKMGGRVSGISTMMFFFLFIYNFIYRIYSNTLMLFLLRNKITQENKLS